MNEAPQPIGTCAVIANRRGHILLGKRKNSYKAGTFGLPGGRIELNEPISDAIAREVFEETGMKNIELNFTGVVRENQGSYDFIHFVFTAENVKQEPELCEPDKCEGWQWLEKDDLKQVLPGHAAAINLVLDKSVLADMTQ